MKCNKCGRELRAGAKRCPYCGTVVPAPGRQSGTGFNWDLKESSASVNSRPREKKSDLTFDWNTDNRLNTGASTGRTSFQEENRWKEPEEARQLFSFDKAHEKLQKQVDRKVDTIVAEKPAPAIERERREDLFVLPSDMTMDDFSDLLGESIVQESDSVLVVNRQSPQPKPQPQRQNVPFHQSASVAEPVKTTEPVSQPSVPEIERPVVVFPPPEITPAPYAPAPVQTAPLKPVPPVRPVTPVQEQSPVREIRPPKKKKQRSPEDQAYDPFAGQVLLEVPEIPAFLSGVRREKEPGLSFIGEPEPASTDKASEEFGLGTLRNLIGGVSPEKPAEERVPSLTAIDPGYTPEEEERAIADFQNLINAEEEFSASVARFTFMSEEESEKADQAWHRWEELSNEPELSFQSLEEEYRESKEKGTSSTRDEKEPLKEEPQSASAEGLTEEKTAVENAAEKKVPEETGPVPGQESREAGEAAEDESAVSAGKVRKAVDLVRKTAGRAAAVAEESVRSLVSEEGESDEQLDRGVFTGLSLSMEEPEKSSSDRKASFDKGKKKPRELNIRINEPTGTQVKVRTEEVELSDQAVNLRDTQQVDLGKLKEGPKSVKVQVEVNHSASSSSVEVTRSNDGSTVVRTVEGGTEKEHLYDASGDDLLYRGSEDETFWQRNEAPATRMTLADIFSPEMMEFKENWETEEAQRRAEGLETVVRAPDLSSEEAMERFLASELETEEEPAESGTAGEPAMTGAISEESTDEAATSAGKSAEETVGEAGETPVDGVDTETENAAEREAVEAAGEPEEKKAAAPEKPADIPEPEMAEAGTETIPGGQEPSAEESSKEAPMPENPEVPQYEETIQNEDLSVANPSVHSREKIEAEAQPEDGGQENRPVQTGEEGRVKRAGKINFKYRKIRTKPEILPAEADSEPEETIPGYPEETGTTAGRIEEEPEEGELQGLFNSLTSIRNRIAEAIGSGGEEENRTAEEKEQIPSTAAPEAGAEKVDDRQPEEEEPSEKEAGTKEESRWSAAAIMKIVIYVLLVAIIIEFTVIGTKLFFPNSQAAVLIHRIEQTISGEDILSTISVESFTVDDAEAELRR